MAVAAGGQGRPDVIFGNRVLDGAKQEELQRMADLMVKFKLIESGEITGLVEDRFAVAADLSNVLDIGTILPDGKTEAAINSSETSARQSS